ncbi:MAG: hypothetical protein RL728_943, partial [Bacteroidota bacterium]
KLNQIMEMQALQESRDEKRFKRLHEEIGIKFSYIGK